MVELLSFFPALNQNLGGRKFKDDCEVQTLLTRDTDFNQQKIEKLVTRYDKSLNCGEDYVVKRKVRSTVKYEALV